jgi:hypothetical protein
VIALKFATAALVAAILAVPPTIHAQDPPSPQGPGRRGSPPQPQQPQGLQYFAGTWTFTWTGRESPLTAGPRTGTSTFTPIGASNFLTIKTSGKTDSGAAFEEAGMLGWSDARKVVAVHERLGTGSEMLSLGDWSSPLSIRFDSSPVQVKSQTIRLRRVYSILSAVSFEVTEEMSVDGGAFQRLGNGEFVKTVK